MKAIMFDLDGTLIDSMPVWQNLASLYLAGKGLALPHSMTEKLRTMNLYEASLMFQQEFGLNDSPDAIFRSMENVLSEHYHNKFQLKTAVPETLAHLRQKGYAMCITTATRPAMANAILSRYRLAGYFSFVQTTEEIGLGKSHPHFFLFASERLGVLPMDCCLFDDSLYALKAAKAIGLKAIGVHDDTACMDEQRIRQVADGYIHSFAELNLREW